jgi:hypothetical protein
MLLDLIVLKMFVTHLLLYLTILLANPLSSSVETDDGRNV